MVGVRYNEGVRWLLALVAMCGCNQLLGLDAADEQSTVLDRDGDGIVDSLDNCRDVPNADQGDRDNDRAGDACDGCPDAKPTRDYDEDGLDDACDPCPLGPNDDDDGDGIMDACDLCPATYTLEQRDSDGDLIGDECDYYSGGSSERLQFISYTSNSPMWQGSDDWMLAPNGSSLTPTGSSARLAIATDDQLVNTTSVMFAIPGDGELALEIGTDVACRVRCAGEQCVLSAEVGALPSSVAPVVANSVIHARFASGTVRIAVPPIGNNSEGTLVCDLYLPGEQVPFGGQSSMERASGTPVIYATAGTSIIGADVIQ